LLLGSNLLSKRIVTNSRFTASLLPLLALRKSTVLYPGVDPALGESGNATSRDNKRILFVGRLVRRKGVDDLIAAFRLVKEAIPDVSLEVVGDGPEMSRLQHLASELGLAGSVAFLGTLRGMALYERFRECDVFAMPSRTLEDDVEGFGTVFLEAGLFGRPSVGTYSGGIPEAVLDGVTGILVKEGDASALANALKTLLVNRELSRELGDNARKRVLQDFTWHEGTNTLVKILDSRR
jgi:phosphatidylinositol alpha-1,6-mannosyltransferase